MVFWSLAFSIIIKFNNSVSAKIGIFPGQSIEKWEKSHLLLPSLHPSGSDTWPRKSGFAGLEGDAEGFPPDPRFDLWCLLFSLFLFLGKKPLPPRARRFTPWPAPISAGGPATPHDSKPARSQKTGRRSNCAASMGLRDRLEPGPELPRTPPFPAGNMFPVARGRQAVRGSPSQSAFLIPLESNTRLPVCPSIHLSERAVVMIR